jgi:hypothetical protein
MVLQKLLKKVSTCPHMPQNLHELKFLFEMLVNQLTCKDCPMFAMGLIIILMCVESPVGLTLKSDIWQSKLRKFLFMLYKFHYCASLTFLSNKFLKA